MDRVTESATPGRLNPVTDVFEDGRKGGGNITVTTDSTRDRNRVLDLGPSNKKENR